MGTTTILDIIGALIIGGILLTTLFRANENAISNNYNFVYELGTQYQLVSIAQQIERDFKRLGYCANPDLVPDPTTTIRIADTSNISFLLDHDLDGVVDSVRYYIGPKSEAVATKNPNDRYLYRIINGNNATALKFLVTTFRLNYFDALGAAISSPVAVKGTIAYMEISVAVESPDAYNLQFSTAFWRQLRLASRNLSNR